MVSFDLFGSKKKKKVPLSHFAEIAKKMLESGKSQQEVAAWLKSQGLKNEHIDAVMRYIIKQAASHSETKPKPAPQQVAAQPAQTQETTHALTQEHTLPINFNQVHQSIQQPIEPEEASPEDEFLMELEEVIDLVLKTKYGDIAKMKESLENIEEMIKKVEKEMNNKVEEINKKIREIESSLNASISEIHSKIEEMLPRLNALESAFKDNVPVMLDELRKIEEKIGYHPKAKNTDLEKQIEDHSNQKEQPNEDKKEELFDLKELMKGE